MFSLIPESQYAELKEVSPRWSKFIDQHVGVPVSIGKFSDFSETSVAFSPLSTIEEMGISTCFLSNIHHLRLPNFKYPNLVRKISFIDYISESCFLNILRALTNLRHLALDLSSIHYLEFLNFSLEFLERLEILQICNGEYSSEWNEEVHPSKNEAKITLDNSNTLLSHIKFPNLRFLCIGFPICLPGSRNAGLILAVFRCLLNHRETIRGLEILFDGRLEALDDPDGEESGIALRTFDLETLSSVKLSSIVINLQDEHQTEELVEFWTGLLNTQAELQRCIFLPRGTEDDAVVELPLPTTAITANSRTLLAFKWFLDENWDNQEMYFLDLAPFQTCSHLADLHLAAAGNNPSTLDSVPLLPPSLRTICIEGVNILKEDVETMVTSLPNLQKLSLSSIGQTREYGMTMSTLKGIYERKALKKLVVSFGFNFESARTTAHENSSFSFILLLVKSRYAEDGDAFFHLKLCESGEYAIIP